MKREVLIPAFLAYRCVLCGSCCRRFEVLFSPMEQQRLSRCNWTADFPQLQGRTLFEPLREDGRLLYRLPHSGPGGACVFLEENRCLMHIRLGFEQKLYACQCYPYTFAVTPTGIYTGLRFDCRGIGPGMSPLMDDRETIERLARSFLKESGKKAYLARMPFTTESEADWDDLLVIESLLTGFFVRTDAPLKTRLLAAALLVEHLARTDPGALDTGEMAGVCEVMAEACWRNAATYEAKWGGARTGRALARQLMGDLLLQAPLRYREAGGWERARIRLRTFLARAALSVGWGRIGSDEIPPVSLRAVRRCRLEPDAAADRVLASWLAGKLFGKSHFGPEFHEYPFVSGLAVLLGVAACAVELARASALSRGERDALREEDALKGVRAVDWRYGALKTFATRPARLRARLLSSPGVASGLIHGLWDWSAAQPPLQGTVSHK